MSSSILQAMPAPAQSSHTEAIVAVSTAKGQAAIGIVRVSGRDLSSILARVFRPRSTATLLRDRKAHLGNFLDETGAVLDEGLLLWFASPASYTGEEVAELHAHGNPWILERMVRAIIASGARTAEPGEFTRRAYLNGKLDLIQADAVIQVIEASSSRALAAARRLLSGALSRRVMAWRERLIGVIAQVELQIDFPEEDELYADGDWLDAELSEIGAEVEALLTSFRQGSRARQGARVVLCGRPNVGKSSLFNALLGYRRSIVSPNAGTTRDMIDGEWELGGLRIRLQDTAGLRKTRDEVEEAGLEMTAEALQGADLALVVIDESTSGGPVPGEVMEQVKTAGVEWLGVKNKCDLRLDLAGSDAEDGWWRVSAITGEGLSELRDEIQRRLGSQEKEEELLLTALWQKEILEGLLSSLMAARKLIHNRMLPTALAYELMEGLSLLDRVTGNSSREDVMDRIFAQFCLGK